MSEKDRPCEDGGRMDSCKTGREGSLGNNPVSRTTVLVTSHRAGITTAREMVSWRNESILAHGFSPWCQRGCGEATRSQRPECVTKISHILADQESKRLTEE